MIATFNKQIIAWVNNHTENIKLEDIFYVRFDPYKHKTVIAYKAKTKTGIAYRGVKNLPVERTIHYNKGNNFIIIFNTVKGSSLLVYDNTLDSFITNELKG